MSNLPADIDTRPSFRQCGDRIARPACSGQMKGGYPCTLRKLIAASASIKSSMFSTDEPCAATCSAVCPFVSRTLVSIPTAISSLTLFGDPFFEARCNRVQPTSPERPALSRIAVSRYCSLWFPVGKTPCLPNARFLKLEVDVAIVRLIGFCVRVNIICPGTK